jgi:hypothetical protein
MRSAPRNGRPPAGGVRPRAVARWLALGLVSLVSFPATATASEARKIANVPASDGGSAGIANVSADARRVLLSAGGGIVSADTTTGMVAELPGAALGRSSQSPSGRHVVWGSRTCRPRIRAASSDTVDAARDLQLPARYARYGIDGLTVADDGRVMVRLGPCRDGRVDRPRVILSAAPEATAMEVVAQSRSGYAEWPVSQSGRVFGLCTPVRRTKSQWTSEVTVVDPRAGLTVRRSRLLTNRVGLGPECVASDAGTATMMVIRARKARNKFTNVGVSVGGQGTPRFSLPGGTRDHGIGLEAVSPNGRQVVTDFDAREATLIDTRTGRYSHAFHPRLDGQAGFIIAEGMPLSRWSPFAPALVFTQSDGAVVSFDPRTLRFKRLGPLTRRAPFGALRTCMLPSGRVLFAAMADRREAAQQLIVTDERRTRVLRIDTSALGTVTSVSCEAAASADAVVIATSSGVLYAVTASTIDGSPFTVRQ